MPGVPKDRGCEACRKLRKKCDLQTPSCGRCLQLGKECIGSGVQRFKFQDQTTTLVVNRGNRSKRGCAKPTMDQCPSNELTLLTAKTASILGIADMRYALAYHMGFLTVVPRRLGRNDTLDTAVRAMTVCFPAVYGQERSTDMFSSFGKALEKLRISLLDCATSNSPEILCAIYIVATCQDWLGWDMTTGASKGEVMAQILSAVIDQDCTDDFRIEMLMTMSIDVIAESVVNPNIQLEPWLTRLKAIKFPNISPAAQMKLANERTMVTAGVVRTTGLIHDYLLEPEQHMSKLSSHYHGLTTQVPSFRARLIDAANSVAMPEDRTSKNVFDHVKTQASLTLMLSVALVFNFILQAFQPHDQELRSMHLELINLILTEARSARRYRPLGSNYMPMCLVAVICTSNDPVTKSEGVNLISNYLAEHQGAHWRKIIHNFSRVLHRIGGGTQWCQESSPNLEAASD